MVAIVEQCLRLPHGYHRWQRQELRRVLRNKYRLFKMDSTYICTLSLLVSLHVFHGFELLKTASCGSLLIKLGSL